VEVPEESGVCVAEPEAGTEGVVLGTPEGDREALLVREGGDVRVAGLGGDSR